MPATFEVPITFGEVPVVRTASDLELAAGKLVTAHYACVLDLDAELLAAIEAEHSAADPTYKALRLALEEADPERFWQRGDTHELGGVSDDDSGMHVDAILPEMVAVGYHRTKRREGGFEATFASPTAAFENDRHIDYLTGLLRRKLTDPRLADPASFRQAIMPNGGSLAFTFIYPDALPQLHDFYTTTDYRISTATVIEGY